MNKAIVRTFMALAVLFAALMVNVVYIQVIRAGALRDKPENRARILQEARVERGRILAFDGSVIAGSRKRDGYWQRTYPQGRFAPQTVGYSSLRYGQSGIEASMDEYLTGQAVDLGLRSWLDRLLDRDPEGADVRLTLVPAVQKAARQALGSQTGAIVALDPVTGAVLAVASTPDYDPAQLVDRFAQLSKRKSAPLLDRALQGLYPPGSSFKVLTAGAALQTGVATPETVFEDTGTYRVSGGKVTNYGDEVFGANTLTEALTYSINTTFGKLGNELRRKRLIAYMERFGFWERPPLELPESMVRISGRYDDDALLPPGAPMDPLAVAWAAVGQEQVLATPLQMTLVAAAVANGGRIMQPYLVDRVITAQGGEVRVTKPVVWQEALDAQYAVQLSEMMQQVVDVGTGTAAALSGIDVAGKTGTAERGDANQAWFIGFAPAEAPRIAVAVTIEDTPGTGGAVAAPLAAAVMRAALDEERLP
jgi:peptidoglycan glycosyltransferase